MKLGFSSLSLFMKSLEEILDIATKDGFNLIEILCEGPYCPKNLLNPENNKIKRIDGYDTRLNNMNLEIFESYDIRVMFHSLTIDLNPATIDWIHANTYENPNKHLLIDNISYFHLNDNLGKKDSHIPLGEGSADFSYNFLKNVKRGIIKLNNHDDVLKGKEYLINIINNKDIVIYRKE